MRHSTYRAANSIRSHGGKSRLFAFAASLPLCLAVAGTALADEAADAEVSELVVTAAPIRESIEKSLQIQKASDNVVNVIAADTIGRFPDATAAGALARLPGVGVQRDQGQERYIQIRGAPTRCPPLSGSTMTTAVPTGRRGRCCYPSSRPSSRRSRRIPASAA